MGNTDRFRLYVRILTLAILTCCLWVFSNPDAVESFTAEVQQTPNNVAIKNQVDTPLRVAAVELVPSAIGGEELAVTYVNQSDKPIRAYAVVIEDPKKRTTTLSNLKSSASVLRPGQARVERYPVQWDQAEGKTAVYVEFVEFTNGKTWGTDVNRSAENLAGQRAGAKAIADYFSSLFASGAQTTALDAVDKDQDLIAIPDGHSDAWQFGYRLGMTQMRQRLKHAKYEGGLKKIKSEIREPYDASLGDPR